ncbi:uncharacterized protein BO80DRAFT_439200 [Aspergillus ibericus CBS 121593]|uniref:Aminoglycoside phosphotransferase domain-containing protein n=1 Tax=Aspergillus ibericus CBS 121593 TaxID=1448316 RepID=A0A395GJN4_9EURO|nr:hypothetical protein BO80DRAFT_439200 [Aspergillus ibericus CBS 121593]RAK95669.1 hypothetical protein BO80DRAFT_439200 [Aspergillus ibericus CBS 121593]
MSTTLPLLHRQITLASALDDDDNVLQELQYPEQRIQFFTYLLTNRSAIEAIVSHHLGLKRKQTCRIGEVKEWISGSFNVCIPVYIEGWTGNAPKRVLIRFPLPYKVGEFTHPGNAEEKLRCEAATFLWIQENCPSIPIPHLWGFGFADGHHFTAFEHIPLFPRLIWHARRLLSSIFGYLPPCRYVARRVARSLNTGYLIMDYVESTEGVMLSDSWEALRHDKTRRNNLFRGLSRIILSIAQVPFPQIVSLTLDNNGVIKLTNRPLTLRLQHLENESIPTNIGRDLTYSTTDSYLLDLLAYHDSRLRFSPNSVRDEYDGQAQLSILTTMRALLPHFTNRDLCRGPFVLTLTDLHQSNIFVDSDWNIKCLVDLEWTCSRPAEMLHPPYWLTGRGVDQLGGEHLDAFSDMYSEFMNVFEEEERSLPAKGGKPFNLTHILKKGWERGNFWYFHALDNPKGLYNIFLDHIQPIFAKLDDTGLAEFERTIAPYWSADATEFLAKKIQDKEVYESQLRDAFDAASNTQVEDTSSSRPG